MPILVVGGATPTTVPPAPRMTGLLAGDGSAVAMWTPQGDGGSSLVRFIVITRRDSNGALVRIDQMASASVTNFTIQPLDNGVAYRVTVQAVNMLGASAESNMLLATPSAAVPPGEEEPPPVDPGPTLPPPSVFAPQPVMYAFPADRTFRAEHWLLTPEEVDAL